jgi:hypothetical protein
LRHNIILKLWREFVEQAYHPFEFFIRGLVIHIAVPCFKPLLTDPEGEGNEADNTVIGPFVAAFQLGDVAGTDEDGFGELGLGKLEGFPGLSNPFIGGHEVKHSGKVLTRQGDISAG